MILLLNIVKTQYIANSIVFQMGTSVDDTEGESIISLESHKAPVFSSSTIVNGVCE
jgi:hypothetical protein